MIMPRDGQNWIKKSLGHENLNQGLELAEKVP